MPRPRPRFRWLALALLAACSGGDSTGPSSGPPVLTKVDLIAPKGTILIGESMQLTATPKDQNGNAYTATVTWTSSSNGVALVNANGLVSATSVGSTTIAAVSGSVSSPPLVVNVIAQGGGSYPIAADVYMPGNIYSPAFTDLARTGTVRFFFPSEEHNVIFNPRPAGTPADIDILKNTTRTLQFNTAGTFNYSCTVHPGMIGTVIVH